MNLSRISSSHVSFLEKLGIVDLYVDIVSQTAVANFLQTKSRNFGSALLFSLTLYRTKGNSFSEAKTVAIRVAIVLRHISALREVSAPSPKRSSKALSWSVIYPRGMKL